MTSEESFHLQLELSTESVENSDNSAYLEKLDLEPSDNHHCVKNTGITQDYKNAHEDKKFKPNYIWTRGRLKQLDDCQGMYNSGNKSDTTRYVVHSIIDGMLKDVIQRTSLNESEDILNAIDNSADCNVHGDVGVEAIVPYSAKTNQNVTQKDNSNSHKDMLNGIRETHHCQDECNGHDVNKNVSFADIETKTSDPMCHSEEVSMIIGSDLHETAAINVPSNNACVLSSTTNNDHLAVAISACVASINNDEENDDSQCSDNCMVNDLKLCCIVEMSTSSSCHSDTSMDMEADVPINLSTPKLKVADEEHKYNRNLPLDFSFQHDIPKSVLNHAPNITGKLQGLLLLWLTIRWSCFFFVIKLLPVLNFLGNVVRVYPKIVQGLTFLPA